MAMQQVGVREIRQNLSKYLMRVAAGETFEITDHGQPVATLGPLRRKHSPMLERLAAEGWAILGTGENLADLGVLVAATTGCSTPPATSASRWRRPPEPVPAGPSTL